MKEQQKFIELLKKIVPSNINLVSEIGPLLNLGQDAVYRRLRCETALTMDETVTLCRHFDIPLESLNLEIPNVVTFKINKLSDKFDSFYTYLESLQQDMQWMTRYDKFSLTYAAEDLPVMYNFFYPNLSKFKIFYWCRSFLNVPEMQLSNFDEVRLPEQFVNVVKQNADVFLKIPGVEIWNTDTLKSTLQQIRFYWDTGMFSSTDSAFLVLKDLENLIMQLRQQAEIGKRFDPRKEQFVDTDFQLYVSDLMIGNNTVIVEADLKLATYIGYNSFNFMRTSNAYFNAQVRSWVDNIIAKSTLVSKTAEKLRNQFFKSSLVQVEELKNYILHN